MNVLLGIGHLQEEQLGNHRIGHSVIDFRADEDNSVKQQAGVDVIGAFSLAGFLDNGGYVVVFRGIHNVLPSTLAHRAHAGKC